METCVVNSIDVASRASPLAQAQVVEVLAELQAFDPSIRFHCQFVVTTGDQDQLTSLRDLGKTDFFTKELDQLVLKKKCRVAIHAAKDLPDPLPHGLVLVALTRGVDASDVLVLRSGEQLCSLPIGAKIGTSSARREEAVKALKADCTFVDLRGSVNERLARLEAGDLDGVVVAEAALVRLGLNHLNRIKLPGETAPLQGKLAIVAREEDREMATLFAPIDARKTLCVGLSLPASLHHREVDVCPLIAIQPRSVEDPAFVLVREKLSSYTHLIFTSKTAATLFYTHFTLSHSPRVIAVGKATAAVVRHFSPEADVLIADEESAEGVVAVLERLSLEKARLLWPHAALARPVISAYLMQRKVDFDAPIFYDTIMRRPENVPNLEKYDELILTSPSTVDAAFEVFGCILEKKILTCIGQVTQNYLEKRRREQ